MLIEALAKFAGELEARELRYAVIGGLAASMRGRIRATVDLDLRHRFPAKIMKADPRITGLLRRQQR